MAGRRRPGREMFKKHPFLAGLTGIGLVPAGAFLATLLTLLIWGLIPGSGLWNAEMAVLAYFIILLVFYHLLGLAILLTAAVFQRNWKALVIIVFGTLGLVFVYTSRYLTLQVTNERLNKIEREYKAYVESSLAFNGLTAQIGPPLSRENDAWFAEEFNKPVLYVTLNFDVDVKIPGRYVFNLTGNCSYNPHPLLKPVPYLHTNILPKERTSMRMHWTEDLKPGHHVLSKKIAVTDIDPGRPYAYLWVDEGETSVDLQISRLIRPDEVPERFNIEKSMDPDMRALLGSSDSGSPHIMDEIILRKTGRIPVTLAERTIMPGKPFFTPVQPRTSRE